MKSRFPQFIHRRLQETYATNTMFASVKSFDGYNAAQVFSGREPYYPWQDSAERSIQDFNNGAEMLQDTTGADPSAWFKAMEFSICMSDLLARKTNRWKMAWDRHWRSP